MFFEQRQDLRFHLGVRRDRSVLRQFFRRCEPLLHFFLVPPGETQKLSGRVIRHRAFPIAWLSASGQFSPPWGLPASSPINLRKSPAPRYSRAVVATPSHTAIHQEAVSYTI